MGDTQKPLREDVRLLGELLGDTLRAREGEALLARVEEVRALAKRAHAGDRPPSKSSPIGLCELPIAAAVPIARAFAHFLTLANIAEQHHRVRRRRDYARDPAHRPQPGSCADAFARWRAGGLSRDALADAVRSLRIELVLTAHPTEIVRRTLLQTHRRIADVLAVRDRPDLTPEESDASIDALRREIATVWQTDEVRDRQVSPLDEVRGALAVFEQTLWEALPRYVRQIDRAIGEPLPLDAAPLRFGSWIGGDRDGNPNVTPEIYPPGDVDGAMGGRRSVRARHRGAPRGAVDRDRQPTSCAHIVGDTHRALPRAAARRRRASARHARACSRPGSSTRTAGPNDPEPPFLDVADFAAPLLLCHRSLVATGNALIAAGRLTDILRRVAAFGLTLAPLDLRQEAARHTEAVAWIAGAWNLGRYEDASEEERIAMLVREIATGTRTFADLPLADPPITEPVRDVLDTFRTAAALPPDSLGAYVITMASRASDVLAVELLQKLAGNRHPQRVVPLFERAADLRAAPARSSTRCSRCRGIARGSRDTRK